MKLTFLMHKIETNFTHSLKKVDAEMRSPTSKIANIIMTNPTVSCRACAHDLEQNEVQVAEDQFRSQKSDYEQLTALEVFSNDSLPQTLCSKCSTLITQFKEFKINCLQSVKVLLEKAKDRMVFKQETDSCDAWQNESEVESEESAPKYIKKPRNVKRKATITEKVTRSKRTKVVPKRYLNNEDDKSEPQAVTQPVEEAVKPKETENKSKTRTCPLCQKEYADLRRLKRHLQDVHGPKKPADIQCEECYRMFTSQTALKKHQMVHSGLKFICEQCGRSFSSSAILNVHKLDHNTTGQPVPCPLCDRTFDTHRQMARHKFRKHSVKFNQPTICLICNTTFGNVKKMQIHRSKTHTVYTGLSDKVLECTYCDMKLKTRETLRHHIQVVHSGERKFPCPDCEKDFKTSTALKKHSYLHSGERPVHCAECGKGFYQKFALDIHMNVHKRQWIAQGMQGIELYQYKSKKVAK